MPPKIKITKEQMIDGALALVRSQGVGALNARALATALGCSTQPIFSNFANMDALKVAVAKRATERLNARTAEEIATGEYLPYKAVGIAYVRFAKEEKELFKLLYMDNVDAIRENNESSWETAVAHLQANGYSRKDAERIHTEMWVFVHGLATTIATGYMDWDFSIVSEMITEVFQGVNNGIQH